MRWWLPAYLLFSRHSTQTADCTVFPPAPSHLHLTRGNFLVHVLISLHVKWNYCSASVGSFSPTENHVVICSAHKKEVSEHLKVGTHPCAHHALAFFPTIAVKSSVLLLPTSRSWFPPCRRSSVFSLPPSVFVFLCKRQCVWLTFRFYEPAEEREHPHYSNVCACRGMCRTYLCMCVYCMSPRAQQSCCCFPLSAVSLLKCSLLLCPQCLVGSFLHLSKTP